MNTDVSTSPEATLADSVPTDQGIVYVLTNSAMPDMVKIGSTRRADIGDRLRELYSTDVPVPFDCVLARQIENHAAVEAALHTAFSPSRVNPSREFFAVSVRQVEAILNLLGGEDVTPEVEVEGQGAVDESSRAAGEQLQRRVRSPLNFATVGIPVGATLTCVRNDDTAEVLSGNRVRYKGEEMSLTQASRLSLGLERGPRPTPLWSYEGQRLLEIYEETYPKPEDPDTD